MPATAMIFLRKANRMKPLARYAAAIAALVFLVVPPAAAVQIDRVKSPGGIEAWLIQDRSVPLVSMQFAFRGGAASDPASKAGRARMTADLLTEGAGDLDAQAFAQALEDRAISLGFDAGLDSVHGSMRTLNEHRNFAFDMLQLALTKPRFDADAVERVRSQTLAALARETQNPEILARRTWMAAAFPEHPYGRPVLGTVETVPALTPDDFRAFVRERLARDNLIVGVVGDITPEALGPLLDRAFGALPAKAVPPEISFAKPAADGQTMEVSRDVPQSVIMFGQNGIRRKDPDWYAASIVNYVLGGGGFNSRLMTELREKRGLTYGIYTSLVSLDEAGILLGSSSTANPNVPQALQLIRAEWQRMAESGPTLAEIEAAKAYLIGSFKLQLSSSLAIASILVAIQYDDLGIDFIDQRDDLIRAVTTEDAKRVAQQLLTPASVLTTVVGNPEGRAGAAPAGGEPAKAPAAPGRDG